MADNATETYRTALKEARADFDRSTKRLSAITRETYELNDEIARLRRAITSLAALCSESPWTDALGITDSCVEVMDAETEEVSTQDVVKRLEGLGFDLASQKNPAASVHAVLSRLAEKKKIEKITSEDNNAITWRGPNYAPFEPSDDDIPF